MPVNLAMLQGIWPIVDTNSIWIYVNSFLLPMIGGRVITIKRNSLKWTSGRWMDMNRNSRILKLEKSFKKVWIINISLCVADVYFIFGLLYTFWAALSGLRVNKQCAMLIFTNLITQSRDFQKYFFQNILSTSYFYYFPYFIKCLLIKYIPVERAEPLDT